MKIVVLLVFFLGKLLFPNAGKDGYVLKVWMDPDCPVCIYQSLHLRNLLSENPNVRLELYFPRNSKASILPFVRKYGLRSAYIFEDKNGIEAKKLGIKVVPEVRLFSNENVLIYGGALNDACPIIGHCNTPRRNYVSDALQQHQAAYPVEIPFVNPIGCVLY